MEIGDGVRSGDQQGMTGPGGMTRWVLHFDMDAFFASVEQLTRPTLRGRPVLVGGMGGRGVVAGASYEARAFGARSAMPVHGPAGWSARQRWCCRRAAPFTGMASRRVLDTVRAMVPVLEQLSLDEAFGEPPELAGATAAEVEGLLRGTAPADPR